MCFDVEYSKIYSTYNVSSLTHIQVVWKKKKLTMVAMRLKVAGKNAVRLRGESNGGSMYSISFPNVSTSILLLVLSMLMTFMCS